MATSQVQAVVTAVTEVLGGAFVPGTTVVGDVLTSDQKKLVREKIKTAILNGTVAYKGDVADESKLSRYINGMINNHLMKSKKLNGGKPYNPSKKGTPRDAQLKELNKLLRTLQPGSSEHSQVLQSIQRRKTDLTGTSSKGIDTTILPAEIAEMVGKPT